MNNYEVAMICDENNVPMLDINEDILKEIIILLHKHWSLEQIKNYCNIDYNNLHKKLEILIKEGLVKYSDYKYVPSCMVITLEEGETLNKLALTFVYESVNLIKEKLGIIKEEAMKFDCFRKFSFEDISMFILSNVMLDSVQIDNIEKLFLGKERINRGSKKYYLAILENRYKDKEAFGIYGNMIKDFENIQIGVYGNKRNKKNSLYINSDDLEETSFKVPILSREEFLKLNKLAEIIKWEYINIFKRNKDRILKEFKGSNYYKEVCFEEYFIWFYHFYYSVVTNILIDENIICSNGMDNFIYLILNSSDEGKYIGIQAQILSYR